MFPDRISDRCGGPASCGDHTLYHIVLSYLMYIILPTLYGVRTSLKHMSVVCWLSSNAQRITKYMRSLVKVCPCRYTKVTINLWALLSPGFFVTAWTKKQKARENTSCTRYSIRTVYIKMKIQPPFYGSEGPRWCFLQKRGGKIKYIRTLRNFEQVTVLSRTSAARVIK